MADKPKKPTHLYDKPVEDMTDEERLQLGRMEIDDYFTSHGVPSRYASDDASS